MATSTERFGFTKPAGSDPASVVPLNSNTDLVELYLGRTQDMIAPMYDDTATYDVGDIVTYESRLYKCITAISTAETFDPTKWEETTATQEGGGGGGGSSVIPNPTGTPTDTLSTISIDGTIFDIEGSGGSGSGYTETTLWSGSVTPSSSETVTLDSSLSNYDFIAFEATISGNNGCLIYPASYIMSLDDIVGCIYSSSSVYGNIWIQAIDNMSISLKKAVTGQNVTYTKIVGIKIESSGGGGNSYEETLLFSGQTVSTGEGVTVNLNGNISDYDAIVIDCGRYGEGAWRHGYIWYLTSDISIGQQFLQIINTNDNTTAYWFYDTDTSITWESAYSAYPVTLFSIKGIKFGSGGEGGSSEAGDINYDNTTSQLTADNVQDAIDEIVANVDTASEDILTLQNVQGYDAYDETQTYAVGDYAIYNNHVYECTTAVSTAEPFDSSKWSQTSIEQIIDGVKGDVSQLNSSKANKQWTRILNLSITSNTDQTVQVTYPDGYSELLFSVQRADNGRTIGTNIVPKDQFTGGACYVGGLYTIVALPMNTNANEFVNGVFIYSDATHIEVAFNKGNVNLTARVFAR